MNFKKIAGLLAAAFLVAGVKLSHAAQSFGSAVLEVTVGDVNELAISLKLDSLPDVAANWVQVSTTNFGTGSVAFGASTVTVNGIQIRNDSPGINIKYGLSGMDSGVGAVGSPGYWSIASAAAADTFAVRALFNGTTRPDLGDFSATNDNIYRPDTQDISTAQGNGTDPLPTELTGCLTASPYPTCEVVAAYPGTGTGAPGTWPPQENLYPDVIYGDDATRFVGTENGVDVVPNTYRTAWFRFDAPTSTTVGGVGGRSVTVGVLGNLP